jgi:hypothetical protein
MNAEIIGTVRDYMFSYYLYDDGTAAIVSSTHNSTQPEINIPESIEVDGATYIVIGIYNSEYTGTMFSAASVVETVTFPSTIRKIKNSAFGGFFNCTKVTIPSLLAWCSIVETSSWGDPTYYSHSLCIGDEELEGDVVLQEGAERVANLYWLTKITSITLPSTLKTYQCAAVNCPLIYLYAMEPPEVESSPWWGLPIVPDDATVWVPAGSLEKYKADEKWSQVSDLREMSVDEMTAYDTNGVGDVEINNVVKVSTVDGGIAITTTEATEVAIYSTTGALAKALRVSGEETVSLAPGLYIVRAAGKSYKVRV